MKLFTDYITESPYIGAPAKDDDYTYTKRFELHGKRVSVTVHESNHAFPKRLSRNVLSIIEKSFSYTDKKNNLSARITQINIHPLARLVIITVSGGIYNKNNLSVGTFARDVYFSRTGIPQYVYHDHFFMKSAYHGNGFGRKFVSHSTCVYKRCGFKKVIVHAASGLGRNGVYTWARQGFTAIDGVSWRKTKSFQNFVQGLRRDTENGALSARFIREIDELTNGCRTNVPVGKIARIGIHSKYRSKRGYHIGKELLLMADGWDGQLKL